MKAESILDEQRCTYRQQQRRQRQQQQQQSPQHEHGERNLHITRASCARRRCLQILRIHQAFLNNLLSHKSKVTSVFCLRRDRVMMKGAFHA